MALRLLPIKLADVCLAPAYLELFAGRLVTLPLAGSDAQAPDKTGFFAFDAAFDSFK